MSASTPLLPFQPATMSTAQLAAVSYLARYSGRTHALYAFPATRVVRLVRGQRARRPDRDPARPRRALHPHSRDRGLMDSSRQHDDARRPRLLPLRPHRRTHHRRPSRLRPPAEDSPRRKPHPRLDPARAHPLPPGRPDHHRAPRRPRLPTRHHALRASEAAAVRIEDYADTLRGHRVLHLVGKGNKPATMPVTVPVLRALEACRGNRTSGPLVLRPVSGKPVDRRDVYRMVARIAKTAGIPRHISPHSLRHAAITNALDGRRPAARCADPRSTRRPTHHRALRPRPRQPRDRHGVHFLTAYVAGV